MRTAASGDIDPSLDLEAVLRVLREHPVRVAILFGSQANDTTHASSDIDIAVEFDQKRPGDPSYNETFLGLSVDLSERLERDDIDLVDLHTVSPALADAIFETGVLLLGELERAAEIRRQLATSDSSQQSARERFDAALERIDAHLDGNQKEEIDTGETVDDG